MGSLFRKGCPRLSRTSLPRVSCLFRASGRDGRVFSSKKYYIINKQGPEPRMDPEVGPRLRQKSFQNGASSPSIPSDETGKHDRSTARPVPSRARFFTPSYFFFPGGGEFSRQSVRTRRPPPRVGSRPVGPPRGGLREETLVVIWERARVSSPEHSTVFFF